MQIHYTIHRPPGQPSLTLTVTHPLTVAALQHELAVAGHPPLPAYLPQAGITVHAVVEEEDEIPDRDPRQLGLWVQ